METKVTKLEHSHVQIDVNVDSKTWKSAKENAFKKLAKDVTIKGFRKGKAPENMVRSHIDQVKVVNEAINAMLPGIFSEACAKENIRPVIRPQVDVTNISEDSVSLKFMIVVAPEVKLGQYKGLKIAKEEVKVSAKDVEAALEEIRKQNAVLVNKKGESALGDTIIFDFEGRVGDVVFEGGSAKNYELELGSHSFIPGFEEQLVGHKNGDHVEVKVTFPKQYTPELAGKDAVFACDIHEIKEKKLPELNDDFAKDLGLANVKDLASLKESKKQEIKGQKEAEAQRNYMNKLYTEIANKSEIDLPEEIVNEEVEAMKKDFNNRLTQSGLTLEQYLPIIGQTPEQYEDSLKKSAITNIKTSFVIGKIAGVEKINVTDQDLENEMKKLAEQYKMKIEDVKKALANSLEDFRNNLRSKKVDEFLAKENA